MPCKRRRTRLVRHDDILGGEQRIADSEPRRIEIEADETGDVYSALAHERPVEKTIVYMDVLRTPVRPADKAAECRIAVYGARDFHGRTAARYGSAAGSAAGTHFADQSGGELTVSDDSAIRMQIGNRRSGNPAERCETFDAGRVPVQGQPIAVAVERTGVWMRVGIADARRVLRERHVVGHHRVERRSAAVHAARERRPVGGACDLHRLRESRLRESRGSRRQHCKKRLFQLVGSFQS